MLCQTLTGWSFREASPPSAQTSGNSWIRCKHDKPCTQLHLDLQDAGLIPDPFLLRNADLDSVQEPGRNPNGYEYKLDFLPQSELVASERRHDLVFEGLDTLAEVYLNGKHILTSENMFQTHRVEVTSVLVPGQSNELRIHFSSTLFRARQLEQERGQLHNYNGESARLYVRQAQHQWGWDWQPTLLTYGPYRPVRFESYRAHLEDVWINPVLNDDLSQADVSVTFSLLGPKPPNGLKAELTAFFDKQQVASTELDLADVDSEMKLSLEDPKLWWPWRYGAQNLYHFELRLVDSATNTLEDVVKKDVGMRRVQIIQEPLQEMSGSSFYFEVNKTPIFASGSNWIPAHTFEAAIKDEDCFDYIDLATKGKQDMVRIWGGGNYLKDSFYQECDRKGLMIWHDFMFADGQYPCYPEFEESVRTEVTQQVKRLRNYCSLVIWAGNNEDYQVAAQFDLTYDPNDHSGDWRNTDFPARTLYETVFPSIVKQYSTVPYHPGCPWGGAGYDDATVGDIHVWSVWHGDQLPYQTGYAESAGRFVSEFGMQGLPSKATMDAFLQGRDDERFIQSETFEFHNNADSWERRLALYIFENVRLQSLSLEDWRYASQLMQSDSTTYAFRAFRRGWGPGAGQNQQLSQRSIGGGLIWQINDAWPCVSWSIVDFDRRPKLAYYALKRECADLALDISRGDSGVDIYVLSSLLEKKRDVTVEVFYYDVTKGTLKAATSTILPSLPVNSSAKVLITPQLQPDATDTTLVHARLRKGDHVFCRAYDWPQPLKYLPRSEANVHHKVVKGDVVEVSVDAPVKGIELSVPGQPDARFEDNGFDLTPKDGVVKIKMHNLISGCDKIHCRWYNKASQ